MEVKIHSKTWRNPNKEICQNNFNMNIAVSVKTKLMFIEC